MVEDTLSIDTGLISPNPDNPRLIFREAELASLEESIAQQGILVPLTVYRDSRRYVILDGERRWKCALKLGLSKVPAIVQSKPDKIQNIMMMFAIHKSRKDWDPLPTAIKLKELETLLSARSGKKPTERVLAENASLSVGEVRRLKKLFGLPDDLKDELMMELAHEAPEQKLTVDQVVESRGAAMMLTKRGIINASEGDRLTRALLKKFRERVVTNTVSPRKLSKIAAAVNRGEVARGQLRSIVNSLIVDPAFTVDDAYNSTIAIEDFERSLGAVARKLMDQIDEHLRRQYRLPADLRELMAGLIERLAKLTSKE